MCRLRKNTKSESSPSQCPSLYYTSVRMKSARVVSTLLGINIAAVHVGAFQVQLGVSRTLSNRSPGQRAARNDHDAEESASTYETSDLSSKGVVSSLTGFVNLFMASDPPADTSAEELAPPATPAELLEFVRDDYTVNNYLWTGDIHIPAFDPDCRFTDPTLSFTGRDKFISNVQNLAPIVNSLIKREDGCRSDLLDITLNEEEGYVQSRWNMVGMLDGLPWKPKIDVIGRTRFWYKQVGGKDDGSDGGVRIYFYDEIWEMPAGRALLQLVTPADTIRNDRTY